jgi:hypothetical protein
MIWGVYRDGLIYPSSPVPPEWADGQRVSIEPDFEPSDDPAEIERWAQEMRRSGGIQLEPGERERMQAILDEADRFAKEQVRREMGLDR